MYPVARVPWIVAMTPCARLIRCKRWHMYLVAWVPWIVAMTYHHDENTRVFAVSLFTLLMSVQIACVYILVLGRHSSRITLIHNYEVKQKRCPITNGIRTCWCNVALCVAGTRTRVSQHRVCTVCIQLVGMRYPACLALLIATQYNNAMVVITMLWICDTIVHARHRVRHERRCKEDGDSSVPREWCCPITMALFEQPVRTIYGHVYERSALETWLARGDEAHRKCPLTCQPLKSGDYIQAADIAACVQRWRERHTDTLAGK